MAGIGFQLRRFTQEGTIRGFLKGYYNAALVASGPWVLTVITLMVIQWLMRQTAARTDLFLETVIYIYAFSLITTAPFQLVVTRYLADQLDAQKLTAHIPTLLSVGAVSSVVHYVVGLAFFSMVKVSWIYAMISASLFAMVSNVWLIMAFVGAVRAFHLVASAFSVGTVVSIASAYFLGMAVGEPGYLLGMLMGNSVIVVICLTALAREFDSAESFNFEWVPYFQQMPALPVAGVLYYSAIWSSIMIYWFTEGTPVAPHVLYAYEPLDLASFYAQITILPAVTLFYVHNETNFYEDYRGFYNAVMTRRSLSVIEKHKAVLVDNLKDAFVYLTLIQAVVTFSAVSFARPIQQALEMQDLERQLFVNMCLGAFPQAILLFVVVILFYFQFYREAAITSGVTLLGCLGTGAWTLVAGESTYGLGLLGGTLIGLVIGFSFLFDRLERLEYLTFSSQPMAEEIPFDRSMVSESGRFGTYWIRNGKAEVAMPAMPKEEDR
jgi:uncharacterized membrane protein